MSEIRIQPGNNVPNVQSNVRYNIPSSLSSQGVSPAKWLTPFELRSGVDPIVHAWLEDISGAGSPGPLLVSTLSSQGRLDKTSVNSALSNLSAGEIAVVDEYTIAVGQFSVASVQALGIQYVGQGEQKRNL